MQILHLHCNIYLCVLSSKIPCATVIFSDIDLEGVEENMSHLPMVMSEPWLFIEPLFAPNSPGSDLFALRDGESIKKMEGRSEIEMKRGSSFV